VGTRICLVSLRPLSHVRALPVDGSSEGVIDCPSPARFDAEEKRRAFGEGPTSRDEVLQRWKERGPSDGNFLKHIRCGY
jgi:ring-1,2-phenylacetyl-CoA epoxidase subunit PaaA